MGRLWACVAIVLAIGLAGCGNSNTAAKVPSTPSEAVQTKCAEGTPSPVPTSNAYVRKGLATVGGCSVVVLTDSQGSTLYYYKLDTATTIVCTGSCLAMWRPFHIVAGTPTGQDLPKQLSVLSGPNGPQVLYDAHPMYRYEGDSAVGDAKGQGIGGNWFVATPDL